MGLQFTSPTNGYAFMSYSSVTKTADAGNSWSIPTGCGVIEDFYDGYMIDDNTGFGVGDCGLIAKSTDGGATWTQYEWNNWTEWSCIQIWGVHFTSALNGYATADSGVVFRTTDGGNQWSRSIIAGQNDMLTDVFFINPSTGYIVGKNGKLFKTANGGDSWIAEPSLTTNDLHSVFFISENLGWAVGSNGTILRYGETNTSVNEAPKITGENISIYPNPSSSQAYLMIKPGEELESEIGIYDITGRNLGKVYSGRLEKGQNLVDLGVSGLKNGTYFCRVTWAGGQVCKPFIVNK
jgi:hypothetical protein